MALSASVCISNLIKFLPKTSDLVSEKLKESDTPGFSIKPLRWTARTGAIQAISLINTLDEIHQTTRDEYGLKAAGLISTMENFLNLFGLKLGELVFGASETLSKSLI